MIIISGEIDEVSIEIESSASKATSALDKLIELLKKIIKPLESVKNIASKPFEKLQNSSDKIKTKLLGLNEGFKNLKNNLKQKMSFNLNFKNFKNNFKEVKNKLNTLKQTFKDIKLPDVFSSAFKGLKSVAKSILGVFATIKGAILTIQHAVKNVVNVISMFYKGWFKIASVPFTPLINSLKSIGSHLTSGIGKLKKWIGALFGIRSMYNAIRMSARAWLDSENAAAKQVTADFAYMKYALGSAVAPLMQYLVNLAYQLLAAFARIIYYITGVNIFAKASAGSYAAMANSAGKTAKSAKETAKALQGFDELNNIDLEKNSNSGAGAGGGMPSMDLADLSSSTIFDDLLEKIKAGDWYGLGLEIGKKLNAAMDAIPWNEIQDKVRKGATAVGKILNGLIDSEVIIHIGEMLTRLTETILIGIDTFLSTSMTHFQKLGTQLGQVFNRFSDILPLAGQVLGKFFQSILEIIDGFVIAFDWKRVGTNLGNGINNMFAELNPETAAHIVSEGLIKIFNTITQTIETIDWAEIGRKVTQFIVGIDWNGIGEAISKAVSALLHIDLNIDWSGVNNETIAAIGRAFSAVTNTLQIFLNKLLEIAGSEQFQEWVRKIADKITTISEKIDTIDWNPFVKVFQDIAGLVFDGIDIFVSALKWIGDHPEVVPILEGIAKALLIIAGTIKILTIISTIVIVLNPVVLVIGLIVAGLILLGYYLAELWGNLKKLDELLGGKLSTIGKNIILGLIKGLISAVTGLPTAIMLYVFNPLVNTIKSLFGIHSPSTLFEGFGVNMIQGLINGIGSLVNKVIETWNNLKDNTIQKFVEMKDKIIEKFTEIKNNTTKKTEEIKTFLNEKWEAIKTKVSETVENMKKNVKEKFENMKSNVTTAVENIKTNAIEKWTNIKSKITDVVENIKNNVKDKFENMKSNVTNIFKEIKTSVSNVWDGIWNKIRGVANSILGGIENLVNGVINGINRMIDALNGLKFKAPDWVPLIGGKNFSLNISKVSTISLPRLAKGGVLYDDAIVRVAEYSNSNSNPEIIAPQDILKSTTIEAFKEVLKDNSSNEVNVENMSKIIGEYCYNAIKEGFNEQENEFNVNIGNERVYRGMIRQINRDSNMYGTSTLKV